MESPFFRNRRWYQQPDPSRHPFAHSPSFRGVPIYQVDPTRETHRPGHPIQRPAERNPGPKVVQIPVHFVGSEQVDHSGSALKIQKVFRGFLVRKCLKKIKDIKVQVDEIEERLLKSEVVELVRTDARERLRMNESLMSLLFKLDSICGVDFGVKGCRKAVIRKAIALQERIDAIVAIDLEGNGETVDQETEISVSVETDSSNQSDDPVKPKDSFENAGNLEGSVEYQENLGDVSCVGEGDKIMEVERNDEEVKIIDVGVDREVKVSEANCVWSGGVHENLDLVEDSVDGLKESLSERDEKDKSVDRVEGDSEGKPKEENGATDNKRNRELLERMMEDNEKMMSLMMQLFERNEMQTKMLNALTHRVELLEKAFVCDRLRRKKKKQKSAAACRED
ncbi:hypothetical protein Pfo_024423 [Paulownia fortunei]|nr:hypothetical protein Pfo_024423 [Paulownia fortunei]